jgi:hypothetical protein
VIPEHVIPDDETVTRVQVFRHATYASINGKIGYLVWEYRDGESETAQRYVYDPNGKQIDAAPWSLRQAMQLVETGNWTMEEWKRPNPSDDVPESSYGKEVW